MITMKKSKEKVASLAVMFMLIGLVSLVILPVNQVYAATGTSTVGVVNFQLLLSQHPDTAAAQTTMQAAIATAKTDFETKSATMNDQDKKAYYQQLQQNLQNQEQELLKAISDKIIAVVKEVADAKGLTIVVDKGVAVYGGFDITDEVLKKITGK